MRTYVQFLNLMGYMLEETHRTPRHMHGGGGVIASVPSPGTKVIQPFNVALYKHNSPCPLHAQSSVETI